MRDWRRGARALALLVKMAWYAPLLAGRAVGRRARPTIAADVERWVSIVDAPERAGLLHLLARYPEFRTLYYYRLRRSGVAGAAVSGPMRVLYPGERTLHLASSEIGPGLFVQHGFATILAAERVGANCWINQQVTVGFSRPGERPVIGDGVAIHAGAKVLGAITIGDGARIGANAVVLQDVPPGATAVGVPARIIPARAADTP